MHKSTLCPRPEAPDPTGSVGFPGEVLGTLPQTTPGGLGYDVAVGASATGFNQLLAAETERGLLNVHVTSLNGVPLTLRSLFDLVGAGGLITARGAGREALAPLVAAALATMHLAYGAGFWWEATRRAAAAERGLGERRRRRGAVDAPSGPTGCRSGGRCNRYYVQPPGEVHRHPQIRCATYRLDEAVPVAPTTFPIRRHHAE